MLYSTQLVPKMTSITTINNAGFDEKLEFSESAREAHREFCDPKRCEKIHEHVRFYRSVRSLWLYLLVFFGLCFISIEVAHNHPVTILDYELVLFGTTLQIAMPLFALFPAVVLARLICVLYNDAHEIRCHHLLSVHGILSLFKEEVIAPYEVLLGVHVNQTLMERVLNVGTVFVGTAMTDRPEILMAGIANPYHYGELIKQGIDNVRIVRKLPAV